MSGTRRSRRPPEIEGSSIPITSDVDPPLASLSNADEEAPSTIEGDVCLTRFVSG